AGTQRLPRVGQLEGTTRDSKAPSPAIFKFDGDDRLTICTSDGPGSKRPTEFSGAQGSGQSLVVLERVKPGAVRDKEGGDKERDAADRARSNKKLNQIAFASHPFHGPNNDIT